ncbi:RNA polymerase sigma factor [Microlunatus speluncae]|uniref:RNA polymerase sigma factor n=1 Tax=Microlunatus speluncae TaxID=2594267 RepID=UPI0012667AF8|nr:sigma-70 family RNA polymerase sigma factor [Microlunatus speluncae]
MSSDSRTPDREARFTALYEAGYPELIRFAQRRVDPGRAEDVVAESFLVAWRRIGEVPTQLGDARAWLFGIARNVILNARRGSRRRDALAIRLADVTTTATDGDADLIAQQVDLTAAWGRLPARQQEALALTVLDDLTAPRAAAVLGITPVAFRLRLSRARRALRSLLDHRDPRPARTPAGIPERQSR